MTIVTALSLPASIRIRPATRGRAPTAAMRASRLRSTAIMTRTANAFSLPVGQVYEQPFSHDKDMESTDNPLAMQLPLDANVHPSPLQMQPHWHNIGGSHKCIVYLEPRRNTPLYTAIEEFFRVSASMFGPTEAHQYHPHSSMTGFIDLAPMRDNASSMMAEIAYHLHSLVTTKLSSSLMQGDKVAPQVRTVAVVNDYPHPGTHKIEIKLDTPAVFRSIIDQVAELVAEAGIRPKRMGHISLAYCNKHVPTTTVVSAGQAKQLESLAQSFLCHPQVFDPAKNPWDIVFYELAYKSTSLDIPHRFSQIARWQL
ncbi:hypothetical protein LPJ78_004063 [Coemansia sp. RSA 989]|nr:hypothetical protein BX667DRAFT_495462 [Coemansia mojavensis]KAJ1741057.1 hypothetical protein LPJ68_003223 [Coemansia sp. RSA 1086]KAJ1749615.1 hypothetical protein LPJ79_003599 [Coemansia sp. RSA 1821]KAJ1863391.1 hypothetical protein LPJ78_004063 [Coemansia sp. RSA 989]KAJ1871342.1 hypothetical protein LPJ55_003984 [Coemansia sp. RSA 990]KAJ2629035.1 hypothetical protein H4R22_003557 [Coemansia sp. RSA 1290]KAJ2670972.1 hypothetical protein IWW42_003682 [Coemansia sp. RSA 1085]